MLSNKIDYFSSKESFYKNYYDKNVHSIQNKTNYQYQKSIEKIPIENEFNLLGFNSIMSFKGKILYYNFFLVHEKEAHIVFE